MDLNLMVHTTAIPPFQLDPEVVKTPLVVLDAVLSLLGAWCDEVLRQDCGT